MARVSSITGTGVKAPYPIVRVLEVIPGLATWLTLFAPIILSIYAPIVVAVFIIAFDLFWLMKSIRMSSSLIAGYRRLQQAMRTDWNQQLGFLEAGELGEGEVKAAITEHAHSKPWGLWWMTKAGRRWREHLLRFKQTELDITQFSSSADSLKPSEIYHLVILATYNETLDTLRPSIQAVCQSGYDLKKMIFVLAYEERGGAQTKERAATLAKEFKASFGEFYTVEHPADILGEHKGKGANITYAAKQALPKLDAAKIPYNRVVVTTLDADHRPDKQYFSALTYAYLTTVDVLHTTYQPTPMFLNNIWDAPAPMRVIATSNSFWVMINSVRPQFLRNFAAHAQPLEALLDTDFWSVTSPVEDGHQYWRTFFRYGGRHTVRPLFVPVYQDATLSKRYLGNFKNQYLQMQRWAYGVSDFPYVIIASFQHPEIPLQRRFIQSWRLFEGHYSWATAPLILSTVAWLPLYLSPTFKYSVLAHQLPVLASQIMTLTMMGLLITIWLSLLLLPPRPKRYGPMKHIFMILQWVLVPVVSICFGALAAIDAQTRLLLGKYLTFRVTEKAVKQDKLQGEAK